jgi:hypothetical protein
MRAFGSNEIAAFKRTGGILAACANAAGMSRLLRAFLPNALSPHADQIDEKELQRPPEGGTPASRIPQNVVFEASVVS